MLFGNSGGVMEAAVRTVYEVVTGKVGFCAALGVGFWGFETLYGVPSTHRHCSTSDACVRLCIEYMSGIVYEMVTGKVRCSCQVSEFNLCQDLRFSCLCCV